MPQLARRIYRVHQDEGPHHFWSWPDLDITGYTITMHVELENGEKVDIAAVIDDSVNGAFHFEFPASVLGVIGCHRYGVEFDSPVVGEPSFTLDPKCAFELVVRRNNR